jgi:DNA modification methylase/DNA-directed RNA polymerase subunit RPC12/RpoP
MVNLHTLIKFWARKSPQLIAKEIDNKTSLIADPFCGSGSTGFAAVLQNASAYLFDLNPVAIFVSYNLLNQSKLMPETLEYISEVCKTIEDKTYTLGDSQTILYAVWKTTYYCPHCKKQIDPIKENKGMLCLSCKKRIHIRQSVRASEDVILIKLVSGQTIKSRKVIHDYMKQENEFEVKKWYPEGNFYYPNIKIEFRDGPHIPINIKELFTKRNLYAVSEIYSTIEKIWKINRTEGDLLKLAFIASLASATKMIPFADSSGPSWKVPRYWIPHLREERNFCRSFLRRLILLSSFKDSWIPLVSKYDIADRPNGINKGKFLQILRADALEASSSLPKLDLVVLDPPHYDEINYFELTYLWQKWLEGRYKDKRFSDYLFWKKEINVNERIGKDIEWYHSRLYEAISSYTKLLKRHGKLMLMIHNKDRKLLNETVNNLKKNLGSEYTFDVKFHSPQIPSSTQGLHGNKKYLCIVRIKRVS